MARTSKAEVKPGALVEEVKPSAAPRRRRSARPAAEPVAAPPPVTTPVDELASALAGARESISGVVAHAASQDKRARFVKQFVKAQSVVERLVEEVARLDDGDKMRVAKWLRKLSEFAAQADGCDKQSEKDAEKLRHRIRTLRRKMSARLERE